MPAAAMPLRCGRKNSATTSRASFARRAWTPFNSARTNLTRRPWANFSRTGKNGGCEGKMSSEIFTVAPASRGWSRTSVRLFRRFKFHKGFGGTPKPTRETRALPTANSDDHKFSSFSRQRHPRHQAAGGNSERLGMALVDAWRAGRWRRCCLRSGVGGRNGGCKSHRNRRFRRTSAQSRGWQRRSHSSRSRNRFASWFRTRSVFTSKNGSISARRNARPRNFCTNCRTRIC